MKEFPKSIELRVIDYQIKGFRPSAIVTNMLDPKAISRDEWMRMAKQSEVGRHLDVGCTTVAGKSKRLFFD